MTLIKIRNHKVYDIQTLFRIVLKKIYEPEKMTSMEFDMMMSSINDWTNHIRLMGENKNGMLSAIQNEQKIMLEYIGNLLYEDEEGRYDNRKQMFAEKKIDYKKFHRLPESYKPEDFHEANRHLEEHKKRHPEYYSKPKKPIIV